MLDLSGKLAAFRKLLILSIKQLSQDAWHGGCSSDFKMTTASAAVQLKKQ
jgi:hypothetical protein